LPSTASVTSRILYALAVTWVLAGAVSYAVQILRRLAELA
jgi:hypothetical protein